MMRDDQIDTLLRSLDSADAAAAADTRRARSDLDRVLASDPAAEAPDTWPLRPRKTRPNIRRGVLIGAAAVTLGLVAMPALSGGDPAYATWTAVPATMAPAAAEKAADDCRSSDRDTAGDAARADLAIAEQRGDWTTVILTGSNGWSAMCVTDGTLFGGSFGYSGPSGGSAVPKPRGLIAHGMGVGSTRAGDLSMVAGAAGSDVVGVVFQSRTAGEVVGSVSRGQFVLWFPGNELQDYDSDDDGEGVELLVTYADGSSGPVRVGL